MPRGFRFVIVLVLVLLLLHSVPWSLLVMAPAWPAVVTLIGTAVFALMLVAFPLLMMRGHGKRHNDGLAVIGDSWLGIIWQLFVWSTIGWLISFVLQVAGVPHLVSARWVAAVVGVWTVGILLLGFQRAMRVPPARETDVLIPRLGQGLDGLRLVIIADTHFGPIKRGGWSRRLVERVNELDADVLAHVGDLADGTVAMRHDQVEPLRNARGRLARVYITGNHEYFSGAGEWIRHMTELGWDALHNRHLVISRGGDQLIVAGVDDLTAAGSGEDDQGADLAKALAGSDPALPILLLAHQPKQIKQSIAGGVDLQISGHTHGGQLWPFHYLVMLDQRSLHGLVGFGSRTQLYTSRGSGFWGPPFRVFAPNELSVLTLRSA